MHTLGQAIEALCACPVKHIFMQLAGRVQDILMVKDVIIHTLPALFQPWDATL